MALNPPVPLTNVSISDIQAVFNRHAGGNSLSNFYRSALTPFGRVYDPETIPDSGTISIGDFRGSKYYTDAEVTVQVGKTENPAGSGNYFYGYHSGFNNCSTAPPTFGGFVPVSDPTGIDFQRYTVFEDPNGTDTVNCAFGVNSDLYETENHFIATANGLALNSQTANLFGRTFCDSFLIFRAQWTNVPRASWTAEWNTLFETDTNLLIEEIV